MLVAEIAKYLNKSCVEVEEVLSNSSSDIKNLVEFVNDYNEIVYDYIIPELLIIL